MISVSGAVSLIVTLVVAGLIFWLLDFLIDYVNPREPFKKAAHVILMILAVLIVIGALLQLVGGRQIFVTDATYGQDVCSQLAVCG